LKQVVIIDEFEAHLMKIFQISITLKLQTATLNLCSQKAMLKSLKQLTSVRKMLSNGNKTSGITTDEIILEYLNLMSFPLDDMIKIDKKIANNVKKV
jgi:hypothetical protein